MKTIPMKTIVAAVMFGLVPTSGAQPANANEPPEAKQPANAKQPPVLDLEAIHALESMGKFLREQQSFSVRTKATTDHVLESGQKIRSSATGQLRVRRPDHLRADIVSDRKQRQYFYDGKTFTMNSPNVGYYATVPAPPTIAELADELEDRYSLDLPMVDLFYWGTDEAAIDEITSASIIGSSKIDGVETTHYAFRQPGLDWQIWIEKGDRPVPRKIVLTTTDDPARPEHSLEMTWNLDSRQEDSLFTFVPSPDSQEIAIADRNAQRKP
jgi:hypothetical protein